MLFRSCAITGKIVDYVNGLIEREKILLEEFNKVKNAANNSITDLTSAITEFVKNENNNYLIFEQEILDSLVEYKNETDKEIDAKSLEVDNALNSIDLTNEVATYFTSQLNTDYFNNLYKNIKAGYYIISVYGTDTSNLSQQTYGYNTQEDKLYYGTQEVDIAYNCFYVYQNEVYLPTLLNNKYVLRKAVF